MKLKQAGYAAIITVFIAALLTFFNSFSILPVSPVALSFSRWLVIAALILFGIKKNSLTSWILISMVIGAEIGHDYPEIEKAILTPSQKPKVIICDTIKGKGVSFMEDSLVFHYKYVDDDTYEKALKELI